MRKAGISYSVHAVHSHPAPIKNRPTILTPAATSNYPLLRLATTTTAVTANTAAATTFHFLPPVLLPPAPALPPPPALSPGRSLKKAVAPDPPEAADFVAADAPTPAKALEPKLTSLLVRDMLREARERERLGVRGPSSVRGRSTNSTRACVRGRTYVGSDGGGHEAILRQRAGETRQPRSASGLVFGAGLRSRASSIAPRIFASNRHEQVQKLRLVQAYEAAQTIGRLNALRASYHGCVT